MKITAEKLNKSYKGFRFIAITETLEKEDLNYKFMDVLYPDARPGQKKTYYSIIGIGGEWTSLSSAHRYIDEKVSWFLVDKEVYSVLEDEDLVHRHVTADAPIAVASVPDGTTKIKISAELAQKLLAKAAVNSQ